MILVSQTVVDVSLSLEVLPPLDVIFLRKVHLYPKLTRLSLELKVKLLQLILVNVQTTYLLNILFLLS